MSPNSLLLGKNADRICSGPFRPQHIDWGTPESQKNRFFLVQTITEQFWRNWTKLFFPSLVIRQKWHVEKRNLQIGDVCVMRDSNAIRGEWRLAKVVTCYPDTHGRVRNVELLVKPRQGAAGDYVASAPIYVKRHVNNLVLLVPYEEQGVIPSTMPTDSPGTTQTHGDLGCDERN